MRLLKLVATVSVVCFFSGLSLSYFYTKTRNKIVNNVYKKELKLKQEIISNAENFNKLNFGNFLSIEEAVDKNGTSIGFLIKNKTQGYGGDIEYLLGISLEQEPKIINLKILSHKETPGLGAKIVSAEFLSQYVSRSISELYLKKDSSNGKIDSITGATITSRAITNSIREVLEYEELQKVIKEKISYEKEVSPKNRSVVEQKKPLKFFVEQKYETLNSSTTKNSDEEVVPQSQD